MCITFTNKTLEDVYYFQSHEFKITLHAFLQLLSI